jgi:hypothetical protein
VSKTDDLRAVIEAIPTRTLAAKLRPLMPAIELRLQAGVHLREIVDALNQSAALGAELKFATLKSYLQRHRARQRAGGRQRVLATSEAARALPPRPPAAAAPVVVTPSLLRKMRNEPIDLEALAEIGRSTIKKKGL